MTAILHKASLKADGSWDKPVGTGPFKFGEWKRGEYVTLTRFDDYQSPPGDKPDGYVGSKRPLIDEARFLIVPDAATVKAALVGGSLRRRRRCWIPTSPELEENAAVEVSTPQVAVQARASCSRRAIRCWQRQAAPGDRCLARHGAARPRRSRTVSASRTIRPLPVISAYYDEVQQAQATSYDPRAREDAA